MLVCNCELYSEKLRQEVNEEREKLGKKPIEEGDDDSENGSGGTTEKTVSTTDPDCGMFVKGEHERQLARQKILCKRYSTKPRISRYQCAYLGLIPLGHRFPGRLGRYARRRA